MIFANVFISSCLLQHFVIESGGENNEKNRNWKTYIYKFAGCPTVWLHSSCVWLVEKIAPWLWLAIERVARRLLTNQKAAQPARKCSQVDWGGQWTQNDQGKIILSKMNSNMFERNTMPGLVFTLPYKIFVLADLLWCESTVMRKTCLILPLRTLATPITKSQT